MDTWSSFGAEPMKLDEGLTGLAIERMRPIAVADARRHPRYKFFPETHEEKYRSLVENVPVVTWTADRAGFERDSRGRRPS